MMIDGFTEYDLVDILTKRIQVQKDRELAQINIFKSLSKYPPAFGMTGTVIGMVGLMEQLGGKMGTSNIGSNMAIAMMATLYGLLLANFFLTPVSENLLFRSQKTIGKRQIIIEGVVLIKNGEVPLMVQEKLNSYLAPALRKDYLNLTGKNEERDAA